MARLDSASSQASDGSAEVSSCRGARRLLAVVLLLATVAVLLVYNNAWDGNVAPTLLLHAAGVEAQQSGSTGTHRVNVVTCSTRVYTNGTSTRVYTNDTSIRIYTNDTSTRVYTNNTKIILYGNNFFDEKHFAFGVGREPFVASGCPVNNCIAKEWRRGGSGAGDADAIIFHGWWIGAGASNVQKLTRTRRPHQRYVLFLLEAPGVFITNLQEFPDFFNWTMTYRRDSDVYMPYGGVVPRDITAAYVDLKKNVDDPWKTPDEPLKNLGNVTTTSTPSNKTAHVTWLVSKCKTPSKRELYVQELSKYIQVDIHGHCGPYSCPRTKSAECYHILEQKYMFYLSFENSLCTDYVTEKLFFVLQYDMVPVVYGGANYEKIAPPGSYIDTRNFASPSHLAEYLKHLVVNPAEYNKYFLWKQSYRVVTQTIPLAMCDLCAMLHDPLQPQKSYSSIHEWYSGKGVCHDQASHWRTNVTVTCNSTT